MKASVEIKVKVDGVSYLVKAGEVIPAVLAEYWASCKCIEQMRKDGIIDKDEPVTTRQEKK
jgi:hypothetical protein